MKIAIFNSLLFHYEMFAYILDYCKQRNIIVDCYSEQKADLGWLSFYKKKYKINDLNILYFNPSQYNYIFLITDYDPGYKNYWKYKESNVIVIEHSGKIHINLPAYSYIQTRQFSLSNLSTWCIPLWNNQFFKKKNHLTVCCIGCDPSKENLQLIFSNFTSIQFYIVGRYRTIRTQYNEPNICVIKNIDTITLLELVGQSHYILFAPVTPYHIENKDTMMTGSIPLGYSVGTPILMPESYGKSYGFPGIVLYSNSKIHLRPMPDTDYKIFINHRMELLKRRDSIFNSLLIDVISTTQ